MTPETSAVTLEPAFTLTLPGRPGADPGPAQLRLDDIVIWRTTLADLYAATEGRATLELGTIAARRLESATRLLIARDGEAFFSRAYQLVLESPDTDSSFDRCEITGDDLFSALGLAPSLPHTDAHDSPTGDTLVIAFYLPQFHPFAENDSWWGDGFTEWGNVLSARPQFTGHAMPLQPADLGCYDLRLPAIRAHQARLAAEYGIDGFCYYYYWFSGRRLMQHVLDDILHSGVPETKFCLCWGNETWSRRWDGGTKDVLLAQDHDPDIDETLIADLLPFFADPRYITVSGAPVFLVYRLDIMNEPARVFAAWKRAAVAAGYPGLFIVAARTFALDAITAALADAVVDFPPHATQAPDLKARLDVAPDFAGNVFDYRAALVHAAASPTIHPVTLPGIMPRWDNTARTGGRANIFINSTPGAFRLAARFALDQAAALPPDQRLVFVNSWNEWGEGAMLEPDRLHGHAYLEALRQARGGYAVAPREGARFTAISGLPRDAAEAWIDGFAADARMVGTLLQQLRTQSGAEMAPGAPAFLARLPAPPRAGGNATFDWTSIGTDLHDLVWPAGQTLELEGWAVFDAKLPHPAQRVAYLLLTDLDSQQIAYHAVLHEWTERADVAAHFNIARNEGLSCFGYRLVLGARSAAPGHYTINLLQAQGGGAILTPPAATLVRL